MPTPTPRLGLTPDATRKPVGHGRGRFTEVDTEECWSLLDTTTVGRLAFSGADGIVILPMNFIVFESAVFFRTSVDSPLASLGEGCDDVAFEADHHDDLLQRGWSVLVRGSTAAAGADEAASALASSSRLGPWAPGDRPLVIKLSPRHIDGRAVSLH
jgi:nitroimidazol reductase NimA-like FMN-containing flavoprotein (pyridoxamine 5'-phosphate oxidase superfamily)